MYADFNYSPTGHLSRHGRARVRALFIPFNGQQYFATPLPRRNFRLLASRSSREEAAEPAELRSVLRRAGATRVSARVYARGHSCAGTRPHLCRGHFLPAPPRVSCLSLSLCRASQLFFPRQTSPMQRDALAWCDAIRSSDVRTRLC